MLFPIVAVTALAFFTVQTAAQGSVPGFTQDSLDHIQSSRRALYHGTLLPRLERRSTESKRSVKACKSTIELFAPAYETSGTLKTKLPTVKTYGFINPDKLQDLSFDGKRPFPAKTTDFATEHILELQMASQFLDYVDKKVGAKLTDYAPGGTAKDNTFCEAVSTLWEGVATAEQFAINNVKRDPLAHLMSIYPGNLAHLSELNLLTSGVNSMKERLFGDKSITAVAKLDGQVQGGQAAATNVKDVLTALKYMDIPEIATSFKAEKERFATMIKTLDEVELPKMQRKDDTGKAYGTWKAMGLEAMWNTFVKDKCDTAKTKAVTYIDTQLAALKEAYVRAVMKEQAAKQAAAPANDPDLSNLIAVIEAMDTEWTKYKPNAWPNPF